MKKRRKIVQKVNERNVWFSNLSHCTWRTISFSSLSPTWKVVDCVLNVMAHTQKPDFVFLRNGRVHLNGRGRQLSRLLAAEVCAWAVVRLDTPCSEVVWRVLATHSIRQFSPSLPLPCVTVCHHISTGIYLYCSPEWHYFHPKIQHLRSSSGCRIIDYTIHPLSSWHTAPSAH